MIESFGCFFFVSTELSIRNGSCSSSIEIIFVARRSTMASFSSADILNKLNTSDCVWLKSCASFANTPKQN